MNSHIKWPKNAKTVATLFLEDLMQSHVDDTDREWAVRIGIGVWRVVVPLNGPPNTRTTRHLLFSITPKSTQHEFKLLNSNLWTWDGGEACYYELPEWIAETEDNDLDNLYTAGFIVASNDLYSPDGVKYVRGKPRVKKQVQFKSSSSDSIYEVVIYEDDTMSCNCPGWTRRSIRSCKHTKQVEKEGF